MSLNYEGIGFSFGGQDDGLLTQGVVTPVVGQNHSHHVRGMVVFVGVANIVGRGVGRTGRTGFPVRPCLRVSTVGES